MLDLRASKNFIALAKASRLKIREAKKKKKTNICLNY
jgi:hypothetical protein